MGYLGSQASKASHHAFQAYKDKDVKDCVQIRGTWYWLEENQGETKELLGRYSVYGLGWGSRYIDWDSFSPEEKRLLKTTLK